MLECLALLLRRGELLEGQLAVRRAQDHAFELRRLLEHFWILRPQVVEDLLALLRWCLRRDLDDAVRQRQTHGITGPGTVIHRAPLQQARRPLCGQRMLIVANRSSASATVRM